MLKRSCFFLCWILLVVVPTWAQVQGVEHVVLIGVDGMSPYGVQAASTPRMDQLMNEGAFSMEARAVLPTSSSPNWASMLMGASPIQHGITSNAWRRDNFNIVPAVEGSESLFPTIFSLVREGYPDAYIASIYDWGGISRLFEHSAVDLAFDAQGPQQAVAMARTVFTQTQPIFTFIHMDHVDRALHASGHGSPEYLAAVTEADGYIDDLMNALEAAGMAERTIVIVTSDHGGNGTSHGGETMDEVIIPWIMKGPQVDKDTRIALPVYTYDTAATIAAILGLEIPYAWIGRPVRTAFEAGALPDGSTSVNVESNEQEVPKTPVQFRLSQSYPNPFHHQAQFTLEVVRHQHIRAEVYDVQGRLITSLHDGTLSPGQAHVLHFDAPAQASGTYFLRVMGETFSATRSVVMLK